MPENDQDALVGKMIREHKEQNTIIIRLAAEAKRLADDYTQLGSRLAANPGSIAFPGQEVPAQFADKQYAVNTKIFDGESLARLVDDYRRAAVKRDELLQQLKGLGFSRSPFA